MDLEGKFRLTADGKTVGFGSVISFGESFSKSCSVMPLVSLSVDDTFVLETASQKTYSLSFVRVHPSDYNDLSTDMNKWSNMKWYSAMVAMINRWQMRTDGAVFTYEPDDTNPYIPARMVKGINDYSENVYIKSLSLDYKQGENTAIYGSMELHVGRTHVQTKLPNPLQSISKERFVVAMSDSSGSNWYPLVYPKENTDTGKMDLDGCVESYTLYGGPESPFEQITMVIPRNRLMEVAPNLVDDLVHGRNKVVLNAVGRCNATVAKVKLSNKKYEITAYSDAERLRGYTLDSGGELTPRQWIDMILKEGSYGVLFRDDSSLIYGYNNAMDSDADIVRFDAGTNVWYVLQVCAMLLGCKIWFADNKAFVVDCRTDSWSIRTSETPLHYGLVQSANGSLATDVNLYPSSSSNVFYGRLTGSVSLGEEGTDTIVNIGVARCNDGSEDAKQVSVTYRDTESVVQFGEHDSSQMALDSLVEFSEMKQGSQFLANLVSYRREPQQSVTFTLKEWESSSGTTSWVPVFPSNFACSSIVDKADEINISNKSVLTGKETVNLLCMSSYERNYPEGTSRYTFGIMQNIDLSSSTSSILTAQNS